MLISNICIINKWISCVIYWPHNIKGKPLPYLSFMFLVVENFYFVYKVGHILNMLSKLTDIENIKIFYKFIF